MKSDQDFLLRVDQRFPGAQEELRHWHPPAALEASNFGLHIQHHQGNRAIRGRERIHYIAPQAGRVTYLRPAYQLGRLTQRLGMLLHQRRRDNVAEWNRRPDE